MTEIVQRNFTGGELAPELHSRTDVAKYQHGLSECNNMLIRPQGGVYSRPGFRYIGELSDSSKRARLIPFFSFNTEQTYVLVFEEFKIRFIKDGGYIMSGGNPYEIPTSYAEEDLARLSYTQSADVLTICHANFPPTKLSRLSDTIWTLSKVDYASTTTSPTFLVSKPKTDFFSVTKANPAVFTISGTHTYIDGDVLTLNSINSEVDDWTQWEESWFYVRNPQSNTFELEFPNGGLLDSSGYGAIIDVDFLVGTWAFGTNQGEFKRSYEYMVTAVDSNGIESLPSSNVVIMRDTNTLSETYRVRLVISEVAEAEYYRVYKSPSGLNTGIWGWIGDTEGPTFDDNNIAPLTSDAAAKDRQPFQRVDVLLAGVTNANPAVVTTSTPHGYSNGDRVTMITPVSMLELNGRAYFINNVTTNTFELVGVDSTSYGTFGGGGAVHKSENYPQTVSYHQQRQIFANTYSEPQTIYTTRVGDFNSSRDDDAITVTINASQVNEIRHLVPLSSLVILTSGAEWALTEGQDGVLTPATVGVSVQSYNGCSWTRPVTIDNNVIYVQEKGAKLRDLGYEWTSETYSGNDLSIMSSHLFQGYEIEEMTYADEPYGIVWCVRSDGALLGLTYQREHQVWAWHVHGTFGWFESVTTISEDGRDALYAIVRRVDPGSSNVRRYIERMEPRYTDASENAFCVDSGLTYNGAPATTITGLDHLEGNFVSIPR
jgi:hypothetical protein